MTSTATETAAQLRETAAAHDQEAAASFDRCDTDGFVSQWASGLSADKARLQANIVENGGKAEFLALFDLEGNLIPAKWIMTRYGMAWGILADDDPDSRIVRWVRHSEARKATTARAADARKGIVVGYVLAPAKADTSGGNGTGLGGAMSVHVIAKRTDGGFSRDVEIIDNGQGENGGTYYRNW